jgi:hypothetical protein
MAGTMSRVLANASAADRPDTDFYATPEDVTEALILKMGWPTSMSVWEPAAGDERMADVFRNRGYNVTSTDLNVEPYWDFTKLTVSYGDLIVTNPPFIASEAFILNAYRLRPQAFAFLLKSQYWHASRRYKLFHECRPSRILPLTWRPDFLFGKKSSAPTMDVLWTVWEYPYNNATTIFEPLTRVRVR